MTITSYSVNGQITSVRLASASNISGTYYNGISNNGVGATLTALSNGSLVIDSTDCENGDRVFLFSQSNSNENGIYDVIENGSSISKWILQRSNDFQSLEQLNIGQFFSVGGGVTLAGNMFVLVEPLPSQIGIGNINILNVTGSSTGGPFLKVANNLSDVESVNDSYVNLGLGEPFLSLFDFNFVDGLYTITNPPPTNVTVGVNTPGNTIRLPANFNDIGSLTKGQSIYFRSISSVPVNIENNDGSEFLATIQPLGFYQMLLVDDSSPTPAGTWTSRPFVTSFNGMNGDLTIPIIVESWDGSTTPVDVTAGDGIDITDGVISLTGTGASVGYGYLSIKGTGSNAPIDESPTSFPLLNRYLIPWSVNTIFVNDTDNLAPYFSNPTPGSNCFAGIENVGTESGVYEITFMPSLRYSTGNTNPTSTDYFLSANLNLTGDGSGAFIPINPISSGGGYNSGSDIPFIINPNEISSPLTYSLQVTLDPGDKIFPAIRSSTSTDAPNNSLVMDRLIISAKKMGDVGGSNAGVTSLNGLTGDVAITSPDNSVGININSGMKDIELSIGIVGIDHGGTNSDSSNFYSNSGAQDGIVYYDSTRLKSASDFTYDPTQGILQITSASANPGIGVSTTFGSTNVAFFSASRTDSTTGNAQYRLLSGLTNEWTWGTFAGSQDLLFTSHNGGNVLMTMSYSDNSVTINSGNFSVSNLTNNRVVLSDSSNNLISLSSGTLGQVLTSNGPGFLPSWSGSSPTPPATYAFSSTLAGALLNSTGDGTLVNVTCDSVNFDIGSNYSGSTGLFTAPVNGIYAIGASVFLGNLSNSHTQYLMYILAGGTTYMISQGNPSNERSSVSNQLTRRAMLLVQLSAGQTAQLQVEVDGSSKTATIGNGGQPTSFYGYLISDETSLIPGPGGFFNYLTNTSTSVSVVTKTMYYNNSATLASYTLPTATGSNQGFAILGLHTAAGGWSALVQPGDSIQLNSSIGTASASSTQNTDGIYVVDAAPNLWVIYDVIGTNITVI